MNDRHPLRDFHDGPGIHAHRKAEYTNATAPLPDSKINRGTYRLTEESIYELLGTTSHIGAYPRVAMNWSRNDIAMNAQPMGIR